VNLREGTQINLVFRRSLERERDRNTNYTAGPQAEFSGFKKGYFKPFWAAWLRNFGRYVVRVQRVGRFYPREGTPPGKPRFSEVLQPDKPRFALGKDRFLIPFRRENLAFSRENLVMRTESEILPDASLRW
jgi:hypothetical protein